MSPNPNPASDPSSTPHTPIRKNERRRRGTASDRVVSTVDPQGRHVHKTRTHQQDGYKAHPLRPSFYGVAFLVPLFVPRQSPEQSGIYGKWPFCPALRGTRATMRFAADYSWVMDAARDADRRSPAIRT